MHRFFTLRSWNTFSFFVSRYVIFLGYKMFFGTQKLFWTFSEVKKGLIKCKIVLDILDGQKRQGWGSTVGAPQTKRAAKTTEKHKQQAAQAEANCSNSCANSTKQQQHKKKTPTTKTAKAATETRGPRRRRPKVSLCSHCRFLVEFLFFQAVLRFL